MNVIVPILFHRFTATCQNSEKLFVITDIMLEILVLGRAGWCGSFDRLARC